MLNKYSKKGRGPIDDIIDETETIRIVNKTLPGETIAERVKLRMQKNEALKTLKVE